MLDEERDECDFNGLIKLTTYMMEWYAKFVQEDHLHGDPPCEGCPYYEQGDDSMTMCEYMMALLLRVVVNR